MQGLFVAGQEEYRLSIFKIYEMIVENAYKASSRFRSSLTSTSIVLGYERTRVSVHGNEGSN